MSKYATPPTDYFQDYTTSYRVRRCDVTHYVRVKMFDTVEVIRGPLKGKPAWVVDIRPNGYYTLREIIAGEPSRIDTAQVEYSDETGIHTQIARKYLNAYRTDFDILDRLCEGDIVESAHGVGSCISGVVQSVDENGLVTIRQGYNADGSLVST